LKKKTKTQQTENAIELRLTRRIEAAGGLALKWPASATAGVPDRIVILGGRVVFVELKRPGGRVRPIQAHMHRRIRAAGGVVSVLDSAAAVDAFVDDLTRCILSP